MNRLVGEILSELRASGLDRNTQVVFTSDNGPWALYDQQGGSAGRDVELYAFRKGPWKAIPASAGTSLLATLRSCWS